MVPTFGSRSLWCIDDFFIRQNSAQSRAVPNGGFGNIGEAFFIKSQKDPLCPSEVVRVGSINFPGPIVAKSHSLNLPPEVLNVLSGSNSRVSAGLDSVLFCGQAKGIPSHRVQNIVAAHTPVARHDIGSGVALEMADMKACS